MKNLKTIGITLGVFLLIILAIFIFKAVVFALIMFVYLLKDMAVAAIIAFLVYLYIRNKKK